MTTLLAIDTASPHCTVALSTAGRVYSRHSVAERQAAQQVLPLVEKVLLESEQSLKSLDGIAVVSGPGSFTGIRIGIGAAQGLALANQTPLLALSTLALLAHAAHRRHGDEYWLVCLPAREQEVYLGAYRCTDQEIEALVEEQVGQAGDLQLGQAAGQDYPWRGAGAGWERRAELEQALDLNLELCLPDTEFEVVDLLELGAARLAAGEGKAAELVQPNYVKDQMNYARSGQT